MKQSSSNLSSPAVGGSSLLVIFSVLCLTVFALLSVSTVQADRRLATASAEAVQAYYQADRQAEEIFARLRAGQTVPGVETDGNVFRYSLPVSDSQTLFVKVVRRENCWQIQRWQTVASDQMDTGYLPVWDGQ